MPKVIYIEVTSTSRPTLSYSPKPPDPEYYFETWEEVKIQDGALGIFFLLENGEGLIFFTREKSALHEIGHFVDVEKGRPSMSDAFHSAVDEYLFDSVIADDYLYNRLLPMYEGYEYHQIYAELYMYNFIGEFPLPEMFEDFFR